MMETNRIIEELRAKASLDWNPEQKPRPDESRRGGQNTVVGDTMGKKTPQR